eukprot:6609715-Alexandrium_andersonii.AAC.1
MAVKNLLEHKNKQVKTSPSSSATSATAIDKAMAEIKRSGGDPTTEDYWIDDSASADYMIWSKDVMPTLTAARGR